MKFAHWFWVLLILLSAGAAFYFFSNGWKRPRETSIRYGIQADHVPFEFAEPIDRAESLFRVDWPPKDPNDTRRLRKPPLLSGRLAVSAGDHEGELCMNFRVELTRADSESDREQWNRRLAFPEFDWMSRVRVWDEDKQWLWPNLPYLLRAYGTERQQRYGGVDPGKGVDNDFAAVVVRPIGSDEVGHDSIAAEWYGPAGGTVDKRSIVHQAFSDDLQWKIPAGSQSGIVGVWLIYADFLESRPPDSWPETPEFNGGALAYFSIHWKLDDDGLVQINKVLNETPPATTGVDWPAWLAETKFDESDGS